jgi:uncharacterized protein YndB with AHSA1/START domain
MTLTTNITKDPAALTMTISVELDVPVERAWQLWADPRQFERWWGPPTHPLTVVDHDLVPGGRVTSFMTGPEGDRHDNCWEVRALDPPKRLELKDAITDEDGTPTDGGPTGIVVTLTERAGGGTLMAVESQFPSLEAMEQAIAMRMDEGITAAMGQIEAILAVGNDA